MPVAASERRHKRSAVWYVTSIAAPTLSRPRIEVKPHVSRAPVHGNSPHSGQISSSVDGGISSGQWRV